MPAAHAPILRRHNLNIGGSGTRPIVFVHGYGCNQTMWRHMVPLFAEDFRVYLFDHIGTAEAGIDGFDPDAYSRLERYADDLEAFLTALGLVDVVLVGHSVSAMICGLVAARRPERIARLVMIGPSPRYLNDGDYRGGFERSDIDELLATIEGNYQGWSAAMAPAIMGRPDAPAHGEELTERFCEQDPEVAHAFARATFLSDNRDDLASITVPTLVLQCANDIIAPEHVGRYVAQRLPDAQLIQLEASGHCPNLSAPEETTSAIRTWLAERDRRG